VVPVYETLPGFRDEVDGCRRWEDLPEAAQRYIEYVARFVGVPVRIVSVGPERSQTIQSSTGVAEA
jgi:adenylosuccinate synthase